MHQHLFITHATYLRLPLVILVVFHGVSRNKHTWGGGARSVDEPQV